MEVSISGHKVSQALEQYTQNKIGRLGKYLSGLEHAQVHFSEEQNPRIAEKERCEVTLQGSGHHIRCSVSASDRFAVVDLAVAKLEKQLRKEKTMKLNRWQRGRVRRSRRPSD